MLPYFLLYSSCDQRWLLKKWCLMIERIEIEQGIEIAFKLKMRESFESDVVIEFE
jgi:hypothetical protein